jgi:hypothetical protein
MMMPKIGDKYCYVTAEVEALTQIVRHSYEATKQVACVKAGFVPIELLEQRNTGWVVCVPTMSRIGNAGKYTWEISGETLDTLELIGDAGMQPMAVEMWRLKRSLEVLKRQSLTPATTATPQPTVAAIVKPTPTVAVTPTPKPPKVEKVKPIPTPWPEVDAPKGIRIIKTYADGSQVLDDGKERWLNADWTQPVKYVCR